jgi:hypothetical protein
MPVFPQLRQPSVGQAAQDPEDRCGVILGNGSPARKPQIRMTLAMSDAPLP